MPTSYTWVLLPDPAPPTAQQAENQSTIIVPTITSSPIESFLGFGLLAPFQRDLKNDFANGGGLDLVRSCVAQILGTMASSRFVQGELPWRGEFGSLLYLGKHRKGPVLNELVRVWASDALTRWEPRITLNVVEANFDLDARVLYSRILYDVIDANVPGNNVLFEDVRQDLSLPVAA